MVLEKRDSSFELIRIIAMLLITLSHYVGFGVESLSGLLHDSTLPTLLRFLNVGFAGTVTLGGEIGNDLFILLRGFFLIDSHQVGRNKVIGICNEVWSYSIGLCILAGVTGIYVFSFSEYLISVFPLVSELYWFATYYVVLYILHPYINKIVFDFEKNNGKVYWDFCY